MNFILRPLVLRPFLHDKTRSALTIAGIAAGVAVVVAIQLANQSALRAFQESVDSVAGRANYQIVPESGTLPESLLLRLQPMWSQGVRFAPMIDVDVANGRDGSPLRLLGVDLFSDAHFRDYRYARVASTAQAAATPMSAPRLLSLFGRGSAVVPISFAREQHLALGNELPVDANGKRVSLIIRGLLQPSGPAAAFDGALVVTDIAVAQDALGLDGKLTRIDLLIPNERADAIVRQIGEVMPRGVRIERPSQRGQRVDTMLRAFRVNLFALAGVALLVGVFLVYNTVLISILRRRRDVGILRLLGTSPQQIFIAFLAEGAVFGAIGSAVGIAAGVVMARSVLGLIGRTVNSLYISSRPEAVHLTPGVAIAAAAIGIAFSTAAAIQPAREAASIPPGTLTRTGPLHRFTHAERRRAAFLALCGFVAAGLLVRLPALGGVPVAGYAAVLAVVLAFTVLAPSILTALIGVSRPLAQATAGVVGRIAGLSLLASLRRTAIATAALSVAVGMTIAVTLMVGSFRATVNEWIGQTVHSDLWLRPARALDNAQVTVFPPEIVRALGNVPFIAAIDPVRGRDVIYGDAFVTVGSSDFAVAADRGTLPMIEPRSARAALGTALRSEGVLVSESFSLRYRRGVGDAVILPTAHGVRSLAIDGIYRDYSNDRGTVVMDRRLYEMLYDDATINTVVIYLKAGTDLEQARRALDRQFGSRYHAFAITNRSIRFEVMRVFDQTFLITYALLIIAIAVGVLGIVTTLVALILERRRELAFLRVTGMTARELRIMLVMESALLGAAAIASGLVMGWTLSWILIHVINKQSFGWTIEFHVPWMLIAVSVITTFAASCVAGLVPAAMASRMDFGAAIRDE